MEDGTDLNVMSNGERKVPPDQAGFRTCAILNNQETYEMKRI